MIARDETGGLVAKIGEDTVRVVNASAIEVVIAGTKHEEQGFKAGAFADEIAMLEAALSFLQAAGEAVSCRERRGVNPFEVDEDGDPVDDGNQWIFEEEVSRWAAEHQDELSLLELELAEGFEC